jgi:type IV pilus assembly protein PilB
MGTMLDFLNISMPADLIEQELARGQDISIINLVSALVEKAYALGASDIHIDPTSSHMRIRLRIDGILQDFYTFPKTIQLEVISRIKVLCNLRTDEHQSAHDGRFRHTLATGEFIDIRVAIAPTYRGENAVLRLLSESKDPYTLGGLGFNEEDQKKITAAIKKTSGMILVTGPTGSGKTTTLYTLMRTLNSKEVAIITIEDPIEYGIEGVEQIQVNPRSGLTFANGLRQILRQDPNIIMVGEIRDAETANIAVSTALTGHLLLSTLHTNDASTTLPRLLDMDIEPFLLASTMNIAIGQRLVRKICEHCRKEIAVLKELAQSLSGLNVRQPFVMGDTIYEGKGCGACNGSGYRGRLSINEVLVADTAIREAILAGASSNAIKKLAIANGMTTMIEDGFAKVRTGQTTIAEVLRVIHE